MKTIASIWNAICSYIAERRLSRLQKRLGAELAAYDKSAPTYWPLQGYGFVAGDYVEGNGEALIPMASPRGWESA